MQLCGQKRSGNLFVFNEELHACSSPAESSMQIEPLMGTRYEGMERCHG